MNSKVIKFVAGSGKTTYSKKYLKENKNGIYLAFTNSVVKDVKNSGFLAKTIDSFFLSFLIPKFSSVIPLIASGSKVIFTDAKHLPKYLIGISNIHIKEDGKICNQGKDTGIDLKITNEQLHRMGNFPNSKVIKYIFSKKELRLTDKLREELSLYLLKNYENDIIDLINSRFSYILIDEAQDLNGYREIFAKVIYNSDIKLILLGDDNQNINGGGDWFATLNADCSQNKSHRCPENNCEWIRNNLGIKIYGTNNNSKFERIEIMDTHKFDDGERTLLYSQKSGKIKDIVDNWKGPKDTIRSAKGSTIENDIVIIGNILNTKNYYTAITRTKKNVYTTIKLKK